MSVLPLLLAACAAPTPEVAVIAPLSAMSLETDCVVAIGAETGLSPRDVVVTAVRPLRRGTEVRARLPVGGASCRFTDDGRLGRVDLS
ncbi:hypothetical protein [Roseisalinus antarcticus]|nr:hypothetical protein [Roseisalinus antarcticus]